jgi:hypothetical protein
VPHGRAWHTRGLWGGQLFFRPTSCLGTYGARNASPARVILLANEELFLDPVCSVAYCVSSWPANEGNPEKSSSSGAYNLI